jgi:uncharacterized surface protein with fasciclin (FAS1) repeats
LPLCKGNSEFRLEFLFSIAVKPAPDAIVTMELVASCLKMEKTMSRLNWRIAPSVAALLIAIGVGAVAPTAPASAETTVMVGGAPMYPSKNIVENAVNSKDHTTLVAAVKAAGLVETLQGAGPFMVFAPTNEAFAKLPAGTVDTLLKPENKPQLVKILTSHVVGKAVMSDAINKMVADDKGAHPVKTLSGAVLIAKNVDGKLTLTDENGGTATVTIADVKQSNGVIHVIDAVLLPK